MELVADRPQGDLIAETKTGMKIRKLKDHIGAEATGVDLREPVDAETRYLLNRALVDHVALVIRDQKFQPEHYQNALQLFGQLMEQDSPEFAVEGAPMLRRISNRNTDSKGNRIKVGMRWHTDHTNQLVPPKYTSLCAVELPGGGGNTSVCNTREGYARLSDAWKAKIDGRKTANVRLGSAVRNVYNTNSLEAQQKLKPKPVFQPLIRSNGDNGTRALYCHPNKMDYIEGYTPEESQDLIDELMEIITSQEDLIYSHEWKLGDMLIWDDRSSWHQAAFDYDNTKHRLMWRGLVRGELPY